MKNLAAWVGVAALAFGAAGAASAADMPMDHSDTGAMNSQMMGEHSMPAKVTMVNHKTGMVHVLSEGMHLVVHFPPTAVKDLKAGAKIKLNMSYSMGG